MVSNSDSDSIAADLRDHLVRHDIERIRELLEHHDAPQASLWLTLATSIVKNPIVLLTFLATTIGSIATFAYNARQDQIVENTRTRQHDLDRITVVELFLKHLDSDNNAVKAVAVLAISELGSDTRLALQAAALSPSDQMREAVKIIGAESTGDEETLVARTLQAIALWFVRRAGGHAFSEKGELTTVVLPRFPLDHHVPVSLSDLRYLEDLPRLSELHLHGPWITDDALPYLYELPALKRLYLHDTYVTTDGMEGLKKALPTLEVLQADQRGPSQHPDDPPA